MYGWRSSVGVICPKDNKIVEPEFNEIAPDGVSVHATRLDTVQLDEMPTAAEAKAEMLSEMGMDVLVYACNASSFRNGPDSHASIRRRLEEVSSLPVTTASTAILEGLKELGVADVDVITPYGPRDNERLREFLTGNDVVVGKMSGLNLAADEVADLMEVNDETARDTYERVMASAGESSAVLIVSTNLASTETLQALEDDLGKPVVSVNQAMLWHSLRLTGKNVRIDGYGTLFRADR